MLALCAGALPGAPVYAATAIKIACTSTPEFGAVFIAKERGIFGNRPTQVVVDGSAI